jgi:replicative DNA helicase
MSREKQIEEMYADLSAIMAEEYCQRSLITPHFTAEKMIAKGYRKASDVAKEIFAEIEKTIADLEYRANTPRKTVKVEELKAQCDWILHEVVPKALAELKKKYTEEKEK